MMTKNEIIEFLRYEPVEHLYIWAKDRIVFHTKGDIDKVQISELDLQRGKNNTLIHNHSAGTPPSVSDVANTIRSEAKELILVTPNSLFSVKRISKNHQWNISLIDFYRTIQKCEELANEEIDKLLSRDIITKKEADIEKSHYIWIIVADIYGFRYSRQEFK